MSHDSESSLGLQASVYVVRRVRLYVSSRNCTARYVAPCFSLRIAQLGVFWNVPRGIAQLGLFSRVVRFPSQLRRTFVGLDGDFTVIKPDKQTVVRGAETKIDNCLETQPLELQLVSMLMEDTCELGQGQPFGLCALVFRASKITSSAVMKLYLG